MLKHLSIKKYRKLKRKQKKRRNGKLKKSGLIESFYSLSFKFKSYRVLHTINFVFVPKLHSNHTIFIFSSFHQPTKKSTKTILHDCLSSYLNSSLPISNISPKNRSPATIFSSSNAYTTLHLHITV